MGALVSYEFDGKVATIGMDDGKLNVLSRQMLAELDAALDRAHNDGAVVLLAGREGVFSAGFDLKALGAGGAASVELLLAGFSLAERLLSFPRPVVIACPGHAIAMGAFLVLSGDYRIGVAGPYKLTANEVAIGMTVPRAAIEICRQRLTPADFNRAVLLAEVYTPERAISAGFLDRVTQQDELFAVAGEVASSLAKLDREAHAATKLRAREQTLEALRAAIRADNEEYRARI